MLAKTELLPTTDRSRPFVGLGAGLVFTRAAGGRISRNGTEGEGWFVSGPLPTLMPEIGVDLGAFRVAAQYAFLVGAWAARSGSFDAGSVDSASATIGRDAPVLNGASLQLGAHFGGPR